MKHRMLIAALIALALCGVLSAMHGFGFQLSREFLIASRWIAIAIFAAYAFYRRSLTTWILLAMLAGAAIGHDWPHLAVNLRLLGRKRQSNRIVVSAADLC